MMLHGCSVVELRQYTLYDGARERLVRLFEDEFIGSQQALGIRVIGPFHDLEDANRFVWLRGFPDMSERPRMLSAFYEGSIWLAHRDAPNGTMIDSDNVLLLRPTDVRLDNPAVTTGLDMGSFARDALVIANIHYVDRSAIKDFLQFFEKMMNPALASTGADVIATFETEPATNTFVRLPVREGETVLIWLAAFRNAGQYEDHVMALRHLPDWRKHASPEVSPPIFTKARGLETRADASFTVNKVD